MVKMCSIWSFLQRLRIYQQRCENFETSVNPYTSCQYAWDEPCYPHRLVVEVDICFLFLLPMLHFWHNANGFILSLVGAWWAHFGYILSWWYQRIYAHFPSLNIWCMYWIYFILMTFFFLQLDLFGYHCLVVILGSIFLVCFPRIQH